MNKYNNFFDRFDKIYCINVACDIDRWKDATNEFIKINLQNFVMRWQAYEPISSKLAFSNYHYPREFACAISHYSALVDALTNQYKAVLIFEDDFALHENPDEKLTLVNSEIPDNWDMIYLGGNPQEHMQFFSSNLFKVNLVFEAHSYALTRKAMIDITKMFFESVLSDFPASAYDNMLGRYARISNAYIVNPPITYSRPGFSRIRNAPRDYRICVNNNWRRHTP